MAIKFTNNQKVLFDKRTGDFIMSNNASFDGELVAVQFTQSEESTVWNIKHGKEAEVSFVFVFTEHESGGFKQIHPENVEIISQYEIKITFSSAVSGFANLLMNSESIEL